MQLKKAYLRNLSHENIQLFGYFKAQLVQGTVIIRERLRVQESSL